MNEINRQQGFALPVIIIVVAIAVIAGGYLLLNTNKRAPEEEMMEKSDKAMMEKDKMAKDDEAMMMAKKVDEIFAKAPSITLKDVSSSGASGTAWLAVVDGKTYHRVVAGNLPVLPGNAFYEGWLVKDPKTKAFFSTGKLAYNPATKQAKLDFVTDGDKSDYRLVVITSEPNDGNPEPDKHIIEERFPAATDLHITLAAMMQKDGEKMIKSEGAMEEKDQLMMKAESGAYKDYSVPLASAESAAGRKVVLYFYAPWCPFCRAADAAFKSQTSNIPGNVTVLKTDYDSETALKEKYGVTYQHTFVQIDAQGNAVTKWVSGDIALLKQNIK